MAGALVRAALALTALAACRGSSPPAAEPAAEVHLPSGSGATAVVVLVPGGGWQTADPAGLAPLAQALTDAGFISATITYGTSGTGQHFPVPVEDVLCGAASAVAQAKAAGRGGGRLVLVGHSAGGQLALLAALRPEALRGACDDPPVTPDAAAGLAGAYDTHELADVAVNLFGVPEPEDPELWHEGNVLAWASSRPELPVLLVHGDADRVVPPAMTESMDRALSAGRHQVRTELVPGNHEDVYQPATVALPLVEWLRALP